MTVRLKPHSSRLLIDAEHLGIWLTTAFGGDDVEYHRGLLAVDRDAQASRLAEQERQELSRVSNFLLNMTNDGRGYLLQRRNGPADFSYIFVLKPSARRERWAWTATLGQAS